MAGANGGSKIKPKGNSLKKPTNIKNLAAAKITSLLHIEPKPVTNHCPDPNTDKPVNIENNIVKTGKSAELRQNSMDSYIQTTPSSRKRGHDNSKSGSSPEEKQLREDILEDPNLSLSEHNSSAEDMDADSQVGDHSPSLGRVPGVGDPNQDRGSQENKTNLENFSNDTSWSSQVEILEALEAQKKDKEALEDIPEETLPNSSPGREISSGSGSVSSPSTRSLSSYPGQHCTPPLTDEETGFDSPLPESNSPDEEESDSGAMYTPREIPTPTPLPEQPEDSVNRLPKGARAKTPAAHVTDRRLAAGDLTLPPPGSSTPRPPNHQQNAAAAVVTTSVASSSSSTVVTAASASTASTVVTPSSSVTDSTTGGAAAKIPQAASQDDDARNLHRYSIEIRGLADDPELGGSELAARSYLEANKPRDCTIASVKFKKDKSVAYITPSDMKSYNIMVEGKNWNLAGKNYSFSPSIRLLPRNRNDENSRSFVMNGIPILKWAKDNEMPDPLASGTTTFTPGDDPSSLRRELHYRAAAPSSQAR